MQSDYKAQVLKPDFVIENLEAIFTHLDELFNLKVEDPNLVQVNNLISKVEEVLKDIEFVLFQNKDKIIINQNTIPLFETFHYLNGLFCELSEELKSPEHTGIDFLISKRKTVLDFMASFNHFKYKDSRVVSPEQQQIGFVKASLARYLNMPEIDTMIQGETFQKAILTKNYFAGFKSFQRANFTQIANLVLTGDYKALSDQYGFDDSARNLKKIIKNKVAFKKYARSFLENHPHATTLEELNKDAKRLLVLDTARMIYLLSKSGYKPHLTTFSKYIEDRIKYVNYYPSLRFDLYDVNKVNVYKQGENLADNLEQAIFQADAGYRYGYKSGFREFLEAKFDEARISLRNGHFLSWDPAKQSVSKDTVLHNYFCYFQENVFNELNGDFKKSRPYLSVEEALDQAFDKMKKRPFYKLMKKILKTGLNNGVSKRALIEFNYIASRLFNEKLEMQHLQVLH